MYSGVQAEMTTKEVQSWGRDADLPDCILHIQQDGGRHCQINNTNLFHHSVDLNVYKDVGTSSFKMAPSRSSILAQGLWGHVSRAVTFQSECHKSLIVQYVDSCETEHPPIQAQY